ncbi:MAG: hypothetical protein KA941_00140 [Flavobacteriales bacterium]|nr:hypothetical protein [Flavobacteriales bacterium]
MKRRISITLFFGLAVLCGSLRAQSPSPSTDVLFRFDPRSSGPVVSEPTGTDQKASPFRMPATPRKTTAPGK